MTEDILPYVTRSETHKIHAFFIFARYIYKSMLQCFQDVLRGKRGHYPDGFDVTR